MGSTPSQLSPRQLATLVRSVFGPDAGDEDLTLLTDLPSAAHGDNPAWADRRSICYEWFGMLKGEQESLPYRSVALFTYPNVGSNNNDLPDVLVPADSDGNATGSALPLEGVLKRSSAVIAMTEFSATAPLKLLGRKFGFRGATMPGFSRDMMPALGLDYEKINARVTELKKRMDRAVSISIVLNASGDRFDLLFDTRFREGHASGGLMREKGVVGNLPSGEAYIVPYEGEREGVPSGTEGTLPVQFDNEIVLYEIRRNRAVRVVSDGPKAREEAASLASEPAYGNMAEVGIGVLGDWGVSACGSTLLDEKLGLHIAFGRSDHFGGITSPALFNDPRRVVHIDRVYVPSVQPKIRVEEVTFHYESSSEAVIRNDKLLV